MKLLSRKGLSLKQFQDAVKAALVFQIHYLSDLDVSLWKKITYEMYAYLHKDQIYLFILKKGHIIW